MENLFAQWHSYPTSDKAQIILAVFTILTFIAISVIGFDQSRKTREALNYADSSNKLTRETSNASDATAKISLDLAQNTLSEMRRSNDFRERITQMEVRAQIVIEEPILSARVGNYPILVTTVIRNGGKSKACKVWEAAYLWGNGGLSGKSMEDSLRQRTIMAKEVADRHKNEGVTLIPGATVTRVFHLGNSLSLQDSLGTIGTNHMFIVGRLRYTDIYHGEHFVAFCYYYDAFSNRLLVYDKFNDAD